MIEYGTIKTFYTKHSYHIFLKKKKSINISSPKTKSEIARFHYGDILILRAKF